MNRKYLLLLLVLMLILSACECNHKEKIIPAVNATCEQEGLTEGVVCAKCGEILVKQEPVPALGHTIEYGLCSRCFRDNRVWWIGEYIDQFGVKTGEKFLSLLQNISGTYNSSVATKDKLSVEIMVDANYISFKMYEYGNRLYKNISTTNYQDYTITMRTPDDQRYEMVGRYIEGGDRMFLITDFNQDFLDLLMGKDTIQVYMEEKRTPSHNYRFDIVPGNFGFLYERYFMPEEN